MAEETLVVDDRSTRLRRSGSGRPVIWLHDTLGNRWTEAHERLAAVCDLIAPTMPGFEETQALKGIDGPEDVVFWLGDLLDELKLERAVLLGTGLGGWMAAEYAIRYPRRVAALVLVDAYGLQVQGSLPEDEFALTVRQLRRVVFSNPDDAAAQAWMPDTEPPDRLEQHVRARVAAARLAWQFPYSVKLRRRLPRAAVPALILWGEEDRLVPVSHGRAYAAGLTGAKLTVLPKVGHYPYVEAPEQFAAEVGAFLKGLS